MTSILPVAPHRLPGLGHLPYLARDQVGFYSSLRDLGPVVRIYFGPMEALLLTDPALIHQVLVTEADKFAKGRIFRKTRPFFGNGVATSDGEFHLRQRRLMSPAFHQQRLAGYGEVMRAEVERMIKGWKPGQRIAWEQAMYAVTPHIIGKTLFGSDLGEEAAAEIHRSLPLVLRGAVTRSLNPLPWLPAALSRHYDEAGRRLNAIIDRIVSSHAHDDTDGGDLLSMLLNARHDDTGKGMSRQQARDEIMTLLVAGTETAAVTLSWLFLELSRHPAVESQLHTELDTVLAGQSITFADLPRLPYLRRVVDETLRLHNPVPMSMRAAQAEVQLGPALARPGTEVVYSPLALHRDPRYHPRPLVFDPDRWASPPAPGTYLPFGGGRHRCIGERFAIAEMMIATATIAAGWRVRSVPGYRVRSVAYTTHHPVSLPMILERR
ncbi:MULTISPECIES: cytochrome P450 [unclassified Crossiella]|uniref:cytochrome P450 n=1 Tax=unclassified Crossiella TaxID=2620835 RepID=UPI001FFEE10D|nr:MULTISPECIES: cytochrome P450 [unclassified Crossiella]MCK2238689.1 cytochrome P450 [Crossiella sp. S99.2]MCK2251741.1 cytochrome P450 [Crossiella sp. S99.1]